MKKIEFLNKQDLQNSYDYKDGNLYWKIKKQGVKIGMLAGAIDYKNGGYRRCRFNGKFFNLHQLIFFYHHGYLPEMVDHIDGNKLNNKIENLRASDRHTNQFNQKLHKRNTSGKKNVWFRTARNKWYISFKFIDKVITKGGFETIEEANNMAILLREKYHKEFARHS